MSNRVQRLRRAVIVILLAAGLILTTLAFVADLIDPQPTPGFGVVQTLLLLLGITSLTVGGYLYLSGRRPEGAPRSLQADIGVRLSLTGLVFAYVSGFADLIQIGTHVAPNFRRPFLGPLQFSGLLIGIALIVLGMILYTTSRGTRESSSLEFLLNGKRES